jgi:23S rRNA pseudouridine2605 synthase
MEKTSKIPGERIAKVIARAGVCSRREAEKMIESGQVTVDGKRMVNPAMNVTDAHVIAVKGTPLPQKQEARLWLYYKPLGLITSHDDPEGRTTVFETLPKHLPRMISVGRLDLNTEGLLLLTNDGGLARHMELPATGWKRCYRARIYGLGEPEQQLKQLADGVTVEGIKYGPIDVQVEGKKDGRNIWALVTLTEGKNREIRKVFEHVGCKVSRLIRVSYGPFQLGGMNPNEIKEVQRNVMLKHLGKQLKP